MATPIQWFGIVHISAKHIRVQILYQLERPVFPFTVIIIKINALLDNSQTDAMIVIIHFQVFIRNAGQIGIELSKTGSTGNKETAQHYK